MKIVQYLQTLTGLFGKAGVLEDLRLTRSQFNDMAEALKSADQRIGKFRTKEMLAIQASFATMVRSPSGKNLFGHIAANINNIQGTIDALEAVVAGEFDERIASQGLDYRRATVLQLTDALVFSARFTLKLLTHALKLETAAAREDKKMSESSTTSTMSFEEDFITDGLNPFVRVMSVILQPSATNVDRLSGIPEILASNANYAQLRSTVGDAKLDPFGMGSTNFRYNPFRAMGMARVEAKVARSREVEVELQMAQLRLMQLERSRQGKEDPNLEREIKYMQALIDELGRELEKLTEE